MEFGAPTTIGWVATLRMADGSRFCNGSPRLRSSAFATQQQALNWAWAHDSTNFGPAFIVAVQPKRVPSDIILDAGE